jgi:hypothetical protein
MYLSRYLELVLLFRSSKDSVLSIKKRLVNSQGCGMRIRIHCNADPESNFSLQCGSGSNSSSKVMRICDHRSTDPPGLHFEPPSVNCERSTALRGFIFLASKASEL